MDDLFKLPSDAVRKSLAKEWDPTKHPRDNQGRWTTNSAGNISVEPDEIHGTAIDAHARKLGNIPKTYDIWGVEVDPSTGHMEIDYTDFKTQDSKKVKVKDWDLVRGGFF